MNKNKKNVVVIALLMFLAYATDCEGQNPPRGAAKGIFSVSSTQKVYFASGNLQYQPSTYQWRFATNPWDYVGTQIPDYGGRFGGTVGGSDNSKISPTYNGWIDLYGWGTGNDPTKISTTLDNRYLQFVDWGSKYGGGWRSLTQSEWCYLSEKRNTKSGMRYAKAIVNGVRGMILLPDDWDKSIYELCNKNNYWAGYEDNNISSSTWNLKFDSAGAVFLPAAVARGFGSSVGGAGSAGYYWTATPYDTEEASCIQLQGKMIFVNSWSFRCFGYSVRLVHAVEN